jgi:hypothetical protein
MTPLVLEHSGATRPDDLVARDLRRRSAAFSHRRPWRARCSPAPSRRTTCPSNPDGGARELGRERARAVISRLGCANEVVDVLLSEA